MLSPQLLELFNEILKRHPLPPAKIAHGYAAASKSLS